MKSIWEFSIHHVLGKNISQLAKEFDLLAFANAKGIITAKEMEDFIQKREEKDRKEKQKLDDIERKYVEKHGRDRTKWTKTIFEQMDDEMFRDAE